MLSVSRDASFVTLEAAKTLLANRFGTHVSNERFTDILKPWLVPRYFLGEHAVILKDDLISALDTMQASLFDDDTGFALLDNIKEKSIATSCVKIDIGADEEQSSPGFFAACSNLLRARCNDAKKTSFGLGETRSYIGSSRVAATDSEILQHL